jgi:GT2 family glycosyltransferase
MSCSLIVSIYKLQTELPLLLSALAQQSQIPDEIIFAEDALSEETIRVLSSESQNYPQLRLRLVQHDDRGFRKSEIVNKAVVLAAYEKLIFLDGDCLPHTHYVRSYSKNMGQGKLLNARPVYLPEDYRAMFLGSDHQFILPTMASIILSAIRNRRYAIYFPLMSARPRKSSMLGSSWACLKNDFIKVNGFDEEFCDLGYGYEDIDMSHRMNRAGVMCFVPKNRVIYYHFGDPGMGESKALALANTKKHLEINDKKNLVACDKGINQWQGKVNFSWVSKA